MRIAIIGMACVFPSSGDLQRYWRNIVEGIDCITEVPANRWDPLFHDAQSSAIDRFYCRRGGFVDADARFDPLAFGIPPNTVEAIEPDQLLTLKVGSDAVRDAGYEGRPFARERTGVIIGRGNYVTAGVLRLEQHVRLVPQILQTMQDLVPDLSPRALEVVQTRLKRELTYYGPDVAAGLIPNLLASRLANRLDLHGPAHTVDAACASSLLAVDQACRSLHHGETDLMLAGGAHLTHDLTFWATFCQLGAFSRSGMMRPLSANADGLLAGEGVGMIVLKRLDDALRDCDRVYAVIEGSGVASDGRSSSVVAPSVTGQAMALERAWKDLPFDRGTLGLLEAHGTGTVAGDLAELSTIEQFFGGFEGTGTRPVIGSVKSMLGHTMAAAGMAGLIKTALAIHHGVLPATLHCDEPHPMLAHTRFRTIARSESWSQSCEERTAAINAFGFGGINAHVVLRGLRELPSVPAAAKPIRVVPDDLPPILMLDADTSEELLQRFDRGEADRAAGTRSCRLVVIAPDPKKLAAARRAIISGKPWNGRQQIWFSLRGLLAGEGKLAFVFPGVDSSFEPKATDLASHFDYPLPRYCEALDPSQSLTRVVIGLLGFNRLMYDILSRLKVQPQGFAGHSVGEWSAMLCSGMMEQSLSDRTNATLDVEASDFPDVQFLAANCNEHKLREAMDGLPDIALTHDNCPHQVLACGRRESVAAVAERLRGMGIVSHALPFISGFHSSLFEAHVQWYRDFFGSASLQEPAIPVWSSTTAGRFPPGMADKQKLAVDHLLQPVRFRSLTEAMYEDGFRVFIQVGTGSLAGFIDDTLSGRPHHAIQANHERRSGLEQLQQLSAALWVEGARFDTSLLQGSAAVVETGVEPSASTRLLPLGVPLLRVREPLEPELLPRGSNGNLPQAMFDGAANDPVGLLLQDTLADIEKAGREVLMLWNERRGRREGAAASPSVTAGLVQLRIKRLLDLDSTIPEVRDHALYPQREAWPIVEDGYPVVPMTMEVMLVRDAVEQALPGRKVIEVRQVKAYNWLAVAKPIEVDISLQSVAGDLVDAEIEGYFKAQLLLADAYPSTPAEALPTLSNPRVPAVDAGSLYRDRWMFHGPAYQGVDDMPRIGDNGIDGLLRVTKGKGALLDNMGQLAGYWVMEQPENCLAMPYGVDRIRFFGEDPALGEQCRCEVRVDFLDALNCVSSHSLRDSSGRVQVLIDGWRTRRYQMDKRFWVNSHLPSRHEVAQFVPPDVTLFEDVYDTANMRDYISRRYLTASERATYDALPPKRRRQWLSGRVAAKDAVRAWMRLHRGLEFLFPQELCIVNDNRGVPHVMPNVSAAVPATLELSIAHKDQIAVAIVGEHPIGIDIERIGPRDVEFALAAFSAAERALLDGEAAAVALVRGWVVKEAAAKLGGKGLGGRPQDFTIEERDGNCFRVGSRWYVTHRLREHIVGWSLPPALSAKGEISGGEDATPQRHGFAGIRNEH